MEKIKEYKQVVQEELEYYQNIRISNAPNLKRHLIINSDKSEFVLLDVGWFNDRYISDLVFHIEVKDQKVWVHEDNTDAEIAETFAYLGIPKSDIVLAFLPDYAKGMTEFSVVA